MVRGNLLASTTAVTSGSTYNIACGARTSLLELLIIGAVPAAVTGLALWWLLAHLTQHEIAVSR